MFRTLGIPTRMAERSLDGTVAEGLPANHFRNIGIRIFCLLHFRLDNLELVDVFHQTLGTGVVRDDARPPGLEWDFTPRPPGRVVESHIDKRALTIYRAPRAYRLRRGRGLVRQRLDDIEATKGRGLTRGPAVQCNQRHANGPGLAGIGMDDNLG